MYNFNFNAVLPFTATINGYDRFLNALVGIIIIPLLLLAGFSAIESDFGKIGPISSDNYGYTSQSNNSSVCTINQKQNFPRLGDSVVGNVWGKGMIFFPAILDDQFINSLSNEDCRKFNSAICDSTIYLSADKVDTPPELIWMVYPELSKAKQEEASLVQVTLSILVDYSGKPLEVKIIDETLIDHSVKQIILKSARTSLFRPAQKNNQSVRCWVQVPLSLEV